MSPVTIATHSHTHHHHHHPTMHPNTAHYHNSHHHYIPHQVSHTHQHSQQHQQQPQQSQQQQAPSATPQQNVYQSSSQSQTQNYVQNGCYSYGQASNCIRTNSAHNQPLFVHNQTNNQTNAYGKHCPNKRCHNSGNSVHSTIGTVKINNNNASTFNGTVHHSSSKQYSYFGPSTAQSHPKPANSQPLLMEPHIAAGKLKSSPATPNPTGAGLTLPLNNNHVSSNSFELTTTPVGGTLSLIASGFANATPPSTASHSQHPVSKSAHPSGNSHHYQHPVHLASQQLSFTSNSEVLTAGSTIQLHRFGLSTTATVAATSAAAVNAAGSPTPGTCPLANLSGANHALYHPSPSAVTEALNHVPPSVLSSEDTYICCSYLPRCFIIQKIKPGSSLACSLESERFLLNHPTYMFWNSGTKELLPGLKFHNKILPSEKDNFAQIPNGNHNHNHHHPHHESTNNKLNQKNDTPPPELIPAPEIPIKKDNQNKTIVDNKNNDKKDNNNANYDKDKNKAHKNATNDVNNHDDNDEEIIEEEQSQRGHRDDNNDSSSAVPSDSVQQSWIELLDNDDQTNDNQHRDSDQNDDNNHNQNNNNLAPLLNDKAAGGYNHNKDEHKKDSQNGLNSVGPVKETQSEVKPKKDELYRKSNEPLDEMFMPMFVRNKSPTCGSLKTNKKTATKDNNDCESMANSFILSTSASTSSLSHPSTPEHSDDDESKPNDIVANKQQFNHDSLLSKLDNPSKLSKPIVDGSELNNAESSTVELFRGQKTAERREADTICSSSVIITQANAPSPPLSSLDTDKSIAATVKSDIPSSYHECQVRPAKVALSSSDSSHIVGGEPLESHVSVLVTPDITVQQQCTVDKQSGNSTSVTTNSKAEATDNSPDYNNNNNNNTTSSDNEEEDCLSLVVVTPGSGCALDSHSNSSQSKTDSTERPSSRARVGSATDKHSSSTYPESASIREANTTTIISLNEVTNNEIILLNDSSTISSSRSNSQPVPVLEHSVLAPNENRQSNKSSPITVANKDSVTMAAIEVSNQESSANENGVVENMNALSIQPNGPEPNAPVQNDNSPKHPQVLRNVRGIPEEELRADLRRQLEYYFSACNLAKDRYLISQMDDEQYVPISIVAGFNEIRRLTHDYDLVVEVLRSTPEVIVDDAGQRVRPNHRRCVVIIRDVPASIQEDTIKRMFDINSCPVKLVKCEFASNSSWYLYFTDDEEAKKAISFMKEKLIYYPDTKIPIMARIKARPLVQQFRTMDYVPTSAATLPGGVGAGPSASVIRPIAPSPVGGLSNSIPTTIPVSHYSAPGTNGPAAVHVQDYIQDGNPVAAPNGAPVLDRFGIGPIYAPYTANPGNRVYMYSPQMLSVSPSQNGCYDLTSVFVANNLTPHTAYPGLVSSISTPSSAPIMAVSAGGAGAAPSNGASASTTLGQPYQYIPMVSVAGTPVQVVGSVPTPAVVTSAAARFNGQAVHHTVGGVHPPVYVSNSNYNTYPKNYRNNNSNNGHGSQNGKRSSKYNPNWHSTNSHHNSQGLPQQQQHHSNNNHSSGGGSFHYNAQYPMPNTSVQVDSTAAAPVASTSAAQNPSPVSTQDPKPPKSRSVNSVPQASKNNGQKPELLKNDNGSRNGGRVGRSYTTAGSEGRPNRSSSNTYRTNNGRYSTNGYPSEGDNRGGLHFNERSSSLKYSKSPANFHGKDSTSGSGGSAHNYSHHQSHHHHHHNNHHSASERNSRSNSSASTIQTDFVLAATAFPPLPGSAAVGNPSNEDSSKLLPLQNGCDSNDKKSSRPASSASQHSQVGECSIKNNDCDNSNSSKEQTSKDTSAPATAAAALSASSSLPVNHKTGSSSAPGAADKDLLLNGNTPDLSGDDNMSNSLKENGETPQQTEVVPGNSSSMTYAQKLKAAKLAKQQQSATLNGDHSAESSISQNA